MKITLIALLLLITPVLQAQTTVQENDDFLIAKLGQGDSTFLYNGLRVEPEVTKFSYIKRISTMDRIAVIECEKSSLLTSKQVVCTLTISKNPVREQSTVFAPSHDYLIAQVENYHEGEALYDSYNFDEMRSKHGRARFFYSDDMRVLVNCINSIRYDTYTCQFGIR